VPEPRMTVSDIITAARCHAGVVWHAYARSDEADVKPGISCACCQTGKCTGDYFPLRFSTAAHARAMCARS